MTQLPTAFIAQMERLLGLEQATCLFEALSMPAPTSIRLNPSKIEHIEDFAPLAESQKVPWATDGYYLDERPTFTTDPLFHAGAYYVQEASSMAIAAVAGLLPTSPLVALDLCAAPGGKSTLWRSLLPEGSLLIANEPLPQRAHILAENLTKWGHTAVAVTNNYPKDFAPFVGQFDLIATDVPCSGEGMFRKDEVAITHWSEANVATCWQRQRTIIEDIWPCLKTGGLLVYSTCTFNREEDEDNIQYICQTLGAECLTLDLPEDVGIQKDVDGRDLPMYHFYPHHTKGEGFFIAVLRKTADTPVAKGKKQKRQPPKPTASKANARLIAELSPWVNQPEEYTWHTTTTSVWIEPQAYSPLLDRLRAHLRVLLSGTEVAILKGKRWQPAHALAMATICTSEAFITYPTDAPTALAYLRAEAIHLPSDLPQGYVLLTYRGLPLGFVNNLGNRANNLYPDAWRIRSNHATQVTNIL